MMRQENLLARALRSASLLSTIFITCCLVVQAQFGNQQITPSVIAGGGGSSVNGSTQVAGTAGQSVTGTSSGGSFTLEGGFWSGAAALTPASLEANAVTGTYGGTASLSATLTSNGSNLSSQLITFTLNSVVVGTATTDAGGVATLNNVSLSGLGAGTYPSTISAQFAGDATYATASATSQLTVQKATPVLQVTGGTFTFDGQPHPASAAALGVNNESLSPITVVYNGSGAAPINAGMYAVVASFAGNQNYTTVVNNQQSIIINQAGQTITFGALSAKTFGDASFTVSAMGGASGNVVTFSSQTPAACSVSSNTVTLLSAGNCTIRASQAGNSNYSAATDVDQSFIVNKAAATITLSNLAQVYDGTVKSAAASTTPSGLTLSFTYGQNGSAVAAPTNAGSYDVTATINDADYQGSVTGVLIINKATPTITWNNPSDITYGTPLSASQLNATANVSGIFTYTPAAGAVLNVGNNQLFVTFTPADAANYGNASQSVQLTVKQITPTEINLGQATYSVGEGDGNLAITVNRTGDTTNAVTVDYATADTAGLQPCNLINGVASQRCDYAKIAGTLRFAAGETSKTIYLPLVDDSYAEGAESFTISLSNPSGESLGTVSTATITITDNETTTGTNPVSSADFFIRQQYIDFLGREPDPPGLRGWQQILNNCQTSDPSCDRIAISSGFFRSPEFQTRGYFIFRFYAAALGRNPSYAQYMPDLSRVSGFLSEAQLEANKTAFAQEFMTRSEFVSVYGSLSNASFVDVLLQTTGLPNHPLRAAWVDALNNETATRAEILRALVESKEVYDKFYNQAFVVMQYFGYLRRDPDALYTQWIEKLNQTGDYRTMINGFINSNEYVLRFGP